MVRVPLPSPQARPLVRVPPSPVAGPGQDIPPPPNRITDTYENITFPRTTYVVGNNVMEIYIPESSQQTCRYADAVHAALHPLYQTQRDKASSRLGGEPCQTSSGISWTERKYPCSESRFCLQAAIRKIPEEVNIWQRLVFIEVLCVELLIRFFTKQKVMYFDQYWNALFEVSLLQQDLNGRWNYWLQSSVNTKKIRTVCPYLPNDRTRNNLGKEMTSPTK